MTDIPAVRRMLVRPIEELAGWEAVISQHRIIEDTHPYSDLEKSYQITPGDEGKQVVILVCVVDAPHAIALTPTERKSA